MSTSEEANRKAWMDYYKSLGHQYPGTETNNGYDGRTVQPTHQQTHQPVHQAQPTHQPVHQAQQGQPHMGYNQQGYYPGFVPQPYYGYPPQQQGYPPQQQGYLPQGMYTPPQGGLQARGGYNPRMQNPYVQQHHGQQHHHHHGQQHHHQQHHHQKKPKHQMPSRTLWVGNVASDWSESDIRGPFEKFGYIENIKMLIEKNCAFVTYGNRDCALKAFGELDKSLINGVSIKIGWGKPDSGSSTGNPPCKNLWVGNIVAETTSEQDIHELFSPFGYISNIKMVPHKACAFVNFAYLQAALNARNTLQGQEFHGRELKINFGRISEKEKQSHLQGHPDDPQIKAAIDTFAKEVILRGSEFEESVRSKNQNDPQFGFLNKGGLYNEYYRYKIFELSNGQQVSQTNQQPPSQSAWTPEPTVRVEVHKPSDTKEEVQEPNHKLLEPPMVELLTGLLEEDDIAIARNWVLAKWEYLTDILKIIQEFTESKDDFSFYLHMLTLIKDICEKREKAKDEDEEYWFYCQITDCAGPLFRGAFLSSTSPEQKQDLEESLKNWRDEETLAASFINELVSYKEGVYGPFTIEGDVIDPAHRSLKKRSRSPSPERPITKKKKLQQ